jgi:hypothetical protein
VKGSHLTLTAFEVIRVKLVTHRIDGIFMLTFENSFKGTFDDERAVNRASFNFKNVVIYTPF